MSYLGHLNLGSFMQYVVRYAKKSEDYTFEVYDNSSAAYARYRELREHDYKRLSFIAPCDEEDFQKAIRGEELWNQRMTRETTP